MEGGRGEADGLSKSIDDRPTRAKWEFTTFPSGGSVLVIPVWFQKYLTDGIQYGTAVT
jgi:hypothetical protein